MFKIVGKISKHWPILLLAILTVLLRLFKLDDLFYFTYDESIPAFVGRRIILWHHVPLIGGVTPFGFHLGPYFYWFYSALLFIGRLNPLIWGWGSALLASLTTYLIYKVGKEFGNKKLAFTAAALWTFSYLANIYDRHLWALYWGPITALLIVFSLNKIVKGQNKLPRAEARGIFFLARFGSLDSLFRESHGTVSPRLENRGIPAQNKFIYVLASVLALSIHADPSNFVFLLVAALSFILFKLPYKKALLIFFSIFIITSLPLIIFDLRHNFSNSLPVFDFIKRGNNNLDFNIEKFSENSLLLPRAFTRLIYTFGDNEVSKQYSYCQYYVLERFSKIPVLLLFLSCGFLVSFIIWSFKTNKHKGWMIISTAIIIYYIGIQIYGTLFQADVFEHYITGLFPLFLLVFAKLFSSLPKKIWLVSIGIFVLLNLFKLYSSVNLMGLSNKKDAIAYTMKQVGDKPFSLDSLSTCWKYNGYRYLFTVFGGEPVKSYVDPNFAYLYGTTPVWEKHPSTIAAFVVHDFQPETPDFYQRYAYLKSHQTASAVFGNIEVIIMENSSSWFDQPETLKNSNVPLSID